MGIFLFLFSLQLSASPISSLDGTQATIVPVSLLPPSELTTNPAGPIPTSSMALPVSTITQAITAQSSHLAIQSPASLIPRVSVLTVQATISDDVFSVSTVSPTSERPKPTATFPSPSESPSPVTMSSSVTSSKPAIPSVDSGPLENGPKAAAPPPFGLIIAISVSALLLLSSIAAVLIMKRRRGIQKRQLISEFGYVFPPSISRKRGTANSTENLIEVG